MTVPQDQVVDDLAPVVTASIAGDVSANPASRHSVTVSVTSTEPGTIAGTARKLVMSGDNTLRDDPTTATAALAFTSTGTNTWSATVSINSINPALTFANSGLVNVQVTVTDDAGNVGAAGLADPDGTAQRAVVALSAGALVFEFDNRLNDGVFAPANIFVISPDSTAPATPLEIKTDSQDPFITINFDAEGTEYAVTSGGNTVAVDTHGDVTLTSAILTNPDATTVDVLADFNKSDANSFVMRRQGLALGNYTLTVQAVDSLGNNAAQTTPTAVGGTTNAESFVLTFEVTVRAQYTLPLSPGLNLVSIPGEPANSDINTVLAGFPTVNLVTTYDSATGLWLVAIRDSTGDFMGNLTTIDAKHAYWMRASSFVNVTVDIPLQALTGQLPPTLPVAKGWNLVPIIDLTQSAFGTEIDQDAYFTGVSWSLVYTFDTLGSTWVRIAPAPPPAAGPDNVATTLGDAVQVGRGYWVFTTAAATIVP